MWANMRIFKVGVTRSLRTRQIAELRNNYTTYINLRMLKVDLCANGAGAYAPYAPPLPTGLQKESEGNTVHMKFKSMNQDKGLAVSPMWNTHVTSLWVLGCLFLFHCLVWFHRYTFIFVFLFSFHIWSSSLSLFWSHISHLSFYF